MRKYKLNNNLSATAGEKVWMGIDAHKETLHVTILNSEGEKVLSQSIPHGRNHVKGLVDRLEGAEIVAVYEAGPTGYRLLRWLEEFGCDAFMCPPTHVRQLRGRKRIKTDQRDSLTLAEQARAGMLPEVHALEDEVYCQRQVERTRAQLVKHRSQTKAQIKSLLLFHGVQLPEGLKANWSKAYMGWLASGPTESPDLNFCIATLVEAIEMFDKQLKQMDKRLEEIEKSERWKKQAALLRSIPGVGALTTMVVLLEAGDVNRFERCEEFASWLGLVPTEWSSGEGQKKGSITRAGNRRIRTGLIESSWTLIRHDPVMKGVYNRICARRGSAVAIVAVARRLALIIRAMLRDEKPYNYEAADA